MAMRFIARAVGAVVEDDYVSAGIAETLDGSGMAIVFQSANAEPEDQDIAQGMDTHCVTTSGQAAVYGAVKELTLSGKVLRINFHSDSIESLGLPDQEIEVRLDVNDAVIESFRSALYRIMTYGRVEARPAVLRM